MQGPDYSRVMMRSPDIAPGRSREARRRARQRLLLVAVAYILLVIAIIWGGDRWATAHTAEQAARLSQSSAAGRASLLISELQKYRLMPIVLGEYPDVHATLAAPNGATAARLNDKLEQIAHMIGSSALYLLDGNGRAIAASNAHLPTSFIGQNYAFRPYFTVSRQKGSAEFFGQGTVSGQPGLYFARAVGNADHPGVIVVKFGFDAVEKGWASASEPAFVTDADGVVLITNRPGWRFRTTRALPPERLAEMRNSRQFGKASLAPLHIGPGASEFITMGGDQPDGYMRASLPVPVAGWTLTVLEPIRPIRSAYLATARLATIAAIVLLVLPLFLWLRARERADLAAVSRIELEEQVARRTEELERTQMHFREAREGLAHANRLGSIGQITAAIAHEINQPVAAIRSFAENASELLRKGKTDQALANLGTISELTTRIGAITMELRSYARRGSGELRRTSLDAAIDGALLFTGHRLRSAGIVLERAGNTAVEVIADPLRLEQILVNLLHNALDAIEEGQPARLLLSATEQDGLIDLVLYDTGAGIAAEVADTLFTPFTTSKPAGLGLGLGIARDIAREFGGELEVAEVRPPWRTAFRLRLRRA